MNDTKRNIDFYKTLFEFTNDSILVLDIKGNVVFQNLALNFGFGSDADKIDVTGKSFFNIVSEKDISRVKDLFQTVLKNPGKKYEFECRINLSQKLQSYINGIFTNQLLNGNINGILIIARDVTEEIDAEKEEKKYKKYQRFLSDTALNFLELSNRTDIYAYIGKSLKYLLNDAVFFIHSYQENNNKLKIEYSYGFSKKGQEIMHTYVKNPGYLSGRLNKKHIDTIASSKLFYLRNGLHDLSLKAFTKELINKFETELKLNSAYIIGINRKSELYGIITIINIEKINPDLFNVIETFVYQLAVAIHRKKLEEQLLIEKKKVEEANRLKSIFLANISHEIRTPMNGIIGFSQLLQDKKLSPEKRLNFINIIETNSQALMNLVNDIIDISKIETGQLKFNYIELNANSFINEMQIWANNEKRLKHTTNLEIKHVKSLADDNCQLFVDEARLKQIMINLLNNAFKFTNAGLIEIGYQIVEDESGIYDKLFRFYVKDTGIGISRSNQKVIFDQFRQVEDSIIKKYGGTGLGLAITKNLVELMGGKIWLFSKINEGSVFYFTIPLLSSLEQTKKVKVTSIMSDEYSEVEKKTILIADQDETNIILLKELIELEDVNFLVCNNGLQTLNILKSVKDIDLILMDIKMPYTDGFNVIKKIKKINSKITVIVQTADILPESKQKSFEAGCDEFLTKPIQKVYLNKYISKYLDKND